MAAKIYKNAAGKRVPSVTTINKVISIGGSEGLIAWANRMGLEGKTLEDARATSADVGTVAHAGVEAKIKGQPFDLAKLPLSDEQRGLVAACIVEWDRWAAQTQLRALEAEVSLVSEEHQYGGTLDALCRMFEPGQLAILDLKTGGSIYPEHIVQVVAYGHLVEETRGEKIDEYHLIRVGKEDASFHHHSWSATSPTVRDAWKMFRLALAAYPLAQVLKKAA